MHVSLFIHYNFIPHHKGTEEMFYDCIYISRSVILFGMSYLIYPVGKFKCIQNMFDNFYYTMYLVFEWKWLDKM